ncbi:hypothetical protein [Terricaulis sp.]|uniref:hypothetical protein n=1 Tax=Terricaulis sp. TaxID=2768686 RepID=UPI003782D463
MPITADDPASAAFRMVTRVLLWTTFLVGAAFLAVFAFAAAVAVGLMIMGAAIALRFAPRRAEVRADGVLDARRTPTGWVVEGDIKR